MYDIGTDSNEDDVKFAKIVITYIVPQHYLASVPLQLFQMIFAMPLSLFKLCVLVLDRKQTSFIKLKTTYIYIHNVRSSVNLNMRSFVLAVNY